MDIEKRKRLILVTGATGYVGGRLVPRLLSEGYRVRVFARDASRISDRLWSDNVDVAEGDVFKPESLRSALKGVSDAYYLIHSMSGSGDFEERDLEAARAFGQIAAECGVEQIIYLGGLGSSDKKLSKHLASRQQTGDALREAGVAVTEFRAAVIVGSGSASFEMIRSLTEKIPVMICPRWVFTKIQPIAISDVLSYLVEALERGDAKGKIIEIGGADVLSYGEMMTGYAKVRGLPRVLIPVPLLTPRLSSYWVHWMTPIPASIARPLIEGIKNEVIVREPTARELFPEITPIGYSDAVERALERLDAEEVETSWSDALSSSQRSGEAYKFIFQEGMMLEERVRKVQASPDVVYGVFTGFGGTRGYPYANLLWRLRGMADRLVGGVGFRRGRRDPKELRVGDAVDFWRVEAVEHAKLLRLRAEMKLPGRAWLQYEVQGDGEDSSILTQRAYFAPRGLLGQLYWTILYPIHALIFSNMIARIARRAERETLER